MSVGPLKSLMAGAAAVGVVAGPMTGAVHAQDAKPIQINASQEPIALVQAGNFGLADDQNVGIMMYYGSGNGSTADEVGTYLTENLQDRAAERDAQVTADYFVQDLPEIEGIIVTFHVGGQAVGPMDIRKAVTEEAFDTVIDTRQDVNRLMALASLDR